jgi:polysaccharide deacetylase family protein (PEP-CTERM system associated)
MLHAFVVDVEDWFHPLLMRKGADPSHDLIREPTLRLLEMLNHRSIKATFFVVGEVASKHPDIVAAIMANGHEIGCHTHTHRPFHELGAQGLVAELEQAEAAIRDACGIHPRMFRGPSFGLRSNTKWVLEILAARGYLVDNSLLPSPIALLGWPSGPRGPFQPLPGIWELPATTSPKMRIPYGGSVYLRLFPRRLISHWVKSNTLASLPSIFYVHPWELLERLPKTPSARGGRWITGLGQARFRRMLVWLLEEFSLGPLSVAFSYLGLDSKQFS